MNQTMAQIFTDGAVEYLDYDFEERKKRLKGRPMNRAVARENLLLLKSVFDRHNIKFWLMFGTCLGAVREGDFIKHDHDTDIGVFLRDKSRIMTAVRELAEQGLEPIRTLPPDTILSLMRNDEYIDLYFYTRETDEFGIPHWTFLREFDRLYGDHFDRFESIAFIGSEFRIPGSTEKLLELHYGRDWRVPIKNTANAVCSSIKDYHRLRGDGFSNRIDLQALFESITDYVVLKRAEKFPNYMECDVIPILCKNRTDFAKQLEASFRALKDADLKLQATRKETEWQLDFFPTGAAHPDLRIEIREDFSAFRTVNIDHRFVQLLLENEAVVKADTAIRVLTDSQDLAYRMFETVEYIDSDPVRADEHRRHIYNHINASGDTTFLKLVNDFSNLKVSVKELNGKRELDVGKKPAARADCLKGDDPSLAGRLRPNILQLISTSQCSIKQVEPKHLLTPERFDVTAKLIYARHRDLNVKSDWGHRLYAAHLNVFNGCREPDGTGKNSLNAFLNAFHLTLESIQAHGFDANRSLVPVGNDNVLLDGAHRIAAAILYSGSIAAVCCDTPAFIYDYEFFRNYTRHVQTGLVEKWTDPMAIEYCRLKQNTYIVSLFPAAEGEDEKVQAILKGCGRIVYAKRVVLQNYGPTLLMRQMYSGEPWVGDSLNRFAGAAQKADLCFNRSGAVRVYLLESDDPAAVTAAKEKIRKIYNIGNHSVHINDSHAEALKLARIFFNENSLHFLNNARENYYEKFHQLFRQYRQWLKTQPADPSGFCIDGSAILAVYGLRQARDLDFLHFGEEIHATGNPLIESHNHEAQHHVTHRDDIVFNPENHFYYQGVKFASLKILRAMKEKRNEEKDKKDLALIDGLKNRSSSKIQREINLSPLPKLVNIVYAHTRANGFAMHKDNTTIVWSQAPIENCDLYAYQDAFSFTGRQPGVNVLLMLEPIVVLPGQYDEKVWRHFDNVLTSLESLADRGGKLIKFTHPVFDGPYDAKSIKSIDPSYMISVEEKKNAVCMISGNKFSHVPGELYSKRVEVARWFHDHSDMEFDVYGRPPFPQLPNYRGELNPHTEKFVTLARYRFGLCFENVYHPFWSRGYLTEKLPHCLMCGTVPIYMGCANIEEYVPTECFIDYRQFSEPARLAAFLKGLSDSDCKSYIDNIRDWVESGNLVRFSIHHTYDLLMALANPMMPKAEIISRPWKRGPAPEYEGRELTVVSAPALWSWTDLASKTPASEIMSTEFTGFPNLPAGERVPVQGEENMRMDKRLRFEYTKSGDGSIKQEMMKLFAGLFEVDVFVETGTFMGKTAEKAAGIFSEVHTIELSQELINRANIIFKDQEHVHVYHGDSSDVFKKILSTLSGGILFWLDAHYSAGNTARGRKNTPIIEELKAIKAARITDAVILIDDIRYFQTANPDIPQDSAIREYPELKKIRDIIFEINSDYRFYILGDTAIAYPPGKNVKMSPVLKACTLSRLFDGSDSTLGQLFDAEKTIAAARGVERETIGLLAKLFPSENQGVGHHYLLWHGLTLLDERQYSRACQELTRAMNCGNRHWRLGWYLSQAANALGDVNQALVAIKDVAGEVPYILPPDACSNETESHSPLIGDDMKRRTDLGALIFSKDRAMQLDGMLKSFLHHCLDPECVDLKVLYTTSDMIHDTQYQQVKQEYGFVEFIREDDFKVDVIRIAAPYRNLLFLVDDNIFVKDFSLKDALNALDNNPDAIGFSLRLGRNITHRLYPEKRRWIIPEFETLGNSIIKFNWTKGDLDMGFGYPLEVSSSIYRVRDLYLLLIKAPFSNPNTLELVLDRQKDNYKGWINGLLCYETSVTFCNPLNLVQTAWKNYSGERLGNSSESLAEKFKAGYRIDIDTYTDFVPNAYHQEVELKFLIPETQGDEMTDFHYVNGLVSIIILNFNGKEYIRGCLQSIRACSTEPYEMIIIDNASTDDSLEYLRSLKDITLVENPENLGCPPARTQAMALARGEYILLLDNDTIVTPGWLTAFVAHARRNPTIGLFGPCSNYVSGPQKVSKVSYTDIEGLNEFARSFFEKHRGCLTIVPRLVGFCMLIKRAVIEKIGAPDPKFGKFGFEDDDYTWRAVIAGFQAAITQDIFVHHFGGPQVRGNEQYNRYLHEAWDIFKRKWALLPELEYGSSFDVKEILSQPFDPDLHFIPVPDRSSLDRLITRKGDVSTTSLQSGILKDQEARLAEGERQFEAGQHQAAEEIFKRLLEDDPGHAQAHNNLGVLYSGSGGKEKALHHYQQAVRLNPENIIFQKNLADFYYVVLGRIEDALRIYVKILAAQPRDTETLLVTGHICVALHRFDDAKVFYDRTLEIDPGNMDAKQNLDKIVSSQLDQGDIEVDKENYNNFQQDEEQGIASRKKYMRASIIIPASGNQKYIKRCVESIKMHTPQPYEVVFINNGATKGTLKWLKRCMNENSNYHMVKCPRDANFARLYNEGIKASTGDPIVIIHDDVIVSHGWFEDMNRSLNSDERVGVVGPMTNAAEGIQKDSRADYGNIDRFDAYAKKIREDHHHRRTPVRTVSDFCLMFRKALSEKIGLFDESFEAPGLMVEDFCTRSCIEGFENIVASDVFMHHYNKHPPGPHTAVENRKIFDAKWRGIDAGTLMGKKLYVMNLLESAYELSQKGKIDDTVKTLIDGISHCPDAEGIYYTLSKVLISAGRFKDAHEVLETMPDGRGKDTGGNKEERSADCGIDIQRLVLTGYCLEGINRYDEAGECADRALALNQACAPALNLKGILAYGAGNNRAAEDLFYRAIESDPGYGEPYTNLGVLKLAEEQTDGAIDFLEKGFVLSPNVNDIAATYHSAVTAIGEFQRAERLFADAVRLMPNNRNLKYLLVDLFIQQDRYDLALKEIEDAMISFDIDDGLVSAALEIREKIGPMETPPDTENQQTVSLCMIVKDEEEYLPRCLGSIKPVVDEMIIVDTGSTDRTRDIAIIFGAKVYDFEWTDDFSAARNDSLSKASGDWIFVLDADEVISPSDYEILTDAVKVCAKEPVAYSITTRNYVRPMNVPEWVANDGKYREEEAGTGWYPSPKIRLFTNDPAMRFEGRVHELVEPSLKKIGISPTPCSVPVHHYGKLVDAENASKGEEYYLLGKKKIEERGGDFESLVELAKQAAELKRHDEAVELWQQVIGLKSDMPVAYLNMSTAYMEIGDYTAGFEASKNALNLDPGLKEAALNYSTCALCAGDTKTAILTLEGLLQQAPGHPVAMALLSGGYCLERDKEKAFEMMSRIKDMGFECGNYLVDLSERLVSAKRIDSAILLLEAAVESKNADNAVFSLLDKCRSLNNG